MNAILLTALMLSGANGMNSARGGHGGDCWDCYEGESCQDEDFRRGMPQSCYNPSFGCYPSTRFMHRYPAFHGYYTRKAYNYRHYFDYPWHAGLHEPTSMFSYNVPGEAAAESVAPPVPMPSSAFRREPTPAIRSANYAAPIVTPNTIRR